jgi:D-sedoheptulose 7-phosphate isomerase
MDALIEQILADSIAVKKNAIDRQKDAIGDAAARLADCMAAGHKVLLFGNGGSAADSQHIAAEFVNRFRIERPPLAAIALTTDTSALTSIGNDYHFDEVFEKQIRALGRSGDIAWGISTSGNSPNVLRGVEAAKELGLYTLGMTGRGGKLADAADRVLQVDSDSTARVQETHITIAHILCELVDRILFPQAFDV